MGQWYRDEIVFGVREFAPAFLTADTPAICLVSTPTRILPLEIVGDNGQKIK